MARGDILCPIDNQPITLPVFNRLGANGTDTEVGDHVHFVVTANGVCANGHRWVIDDSLGEGLNQLAMRRIV